jgi:hypothetical protein
MGTCPVRLGTNIPNIHGFQPNIILEQFIRIKASKEGMSHKSININACEIMGSIILFAFPRSGLGFFFCDYRLLIKGAVRNYRKMLALSGPRLPTLSH